MSEGKHIVKFYKIICKDDIRDVEYGSNYILDDGNDPTFHCEICGKDCYLDEDDAEHEFEYLGYFYIEDIIQLLKQDTPK